MNEPQDGNPIYLAVFYEHPCFRGRSITVAIYDDDDYSHVQYNGVWHYTDKFVPWGSSAVSKDLGDHIGSAIIHSGYWDLHEGHHFATNASHVIHRNGGPDKNGAYPNPDSWNGKSLPVGSLKVYESYDTSSDDCY